MKTLIVGAGVAGLTCAGQFASAGQQVVIVDKGSRPGGRLSTRVSRSGPVFDHGCQYFTAKSATFERHLDQWVTNRQAALWDANVVDLEAGETKPTERVAQRYIGSPKMDDIVQALIDSADGIDGPHFDVKIESVSKDGDGWHATDSNGKIWAGFDRLIIAAPAAQAQGLLSGAAPELAERLLDETKTSASWAVMLAFEKTLDLGFDAAFVKQSPLSWIANNSTKPGRPPIGETGECWVLHGSTDWSDEHVEDDPEAVIAALRDAFTKAVGQEMPEPTYAAAHRWRFAHAVMTLSDRYLYDEDLGVGVCGDACADGSRANVERAHLSGLGLGEHVAGY